MPTRRSCVDTHILPTREHSTVTEMRLSRAGRANKPPMRVKLKLINCMRAYLLVCLLAQRLLSSDFGKIFFKTLSGNEYKAKSRKAVDASKNNWCQEASLDWCFV